MRNLILALAVLFAGSAHAEQYLGKPGNQGAAAGTMKYQGSYIGYFKTKAMMDAFTSAAHLRDAGVLVKAVEYKDAAGRTTAWKIGDKTYQMAYGPIQVGWSPAGYSKYQGVTSGSYEYQGNGTWSFVPPGLPH